MNTSHKNQNWNTLIASFLGWTLDAFDYFIVVMVLTEIGAEFHKSNAEMALTLTVTLAFRPIGAFNFGLLADKYGRRIPLMIDVVAAYSIIEVASGFAYVLIAVVATGLAYKMAPLVSSAAFI